MFCIVKVKERIRQEQDEERQRLESEMQRLVALEEEHRRKVEVKEVEMAKIKEDLERKWDRERRQVSIDWLQNFVSATLTASQQELILIGWYALSRALRRLLV